MIGDRYNMSLGEDVQLSVPFAIQTFFFYGIGGKQAHLSPDVKRLPPPMDICNSICITNASPVGGGWKEGLGI